MKSSGPDAAGTARRPGLRARGRRRTGGAALTLLAFSTCAAAGPTRAQDLAVPPDLTARGVLRVGIKCDSPPAGFLDHDGEPAGIDVEIARRIAAVAFGDPAKVAFSCVTTATRVQMLVADKVDVLFATMGVSEERKRIVDFATSTDWEGSAILVRAGETLTSLDKLDGRTLLTNKGAWQVAFLERHHPGIKLVKYDGINDAIQSLRQGRGDAVTQDQHVLAAAASRDPRLRLAPIQFQIGWSAPAVRRGNTAMRLFVSALVTRFKTDGTYRAAVEHVCGEAEREERLASYTTLPPDGSSDRNSVLPPP